MAEILTGAISMFLFRQGSRNALNNIRYVNQFKSNYQSLWGLRLSHLDTVDAVLRTLEPEELGRVNAKLVSHLISQKVWDKNKLLEKYYRVVIDATGIFSVPEGHCKNCLHKTSKNGVKTYFHNVLEAKLITPDGFAVSIASEWIENVGEYDKQDCELKAFKRLAETIKRYFPRLPICIHADGLYPNKGFFDICKKMDWRFIVTLKDASLKSLWEDIDLELLTSNYRAEVKGVKVEQTFRWLNDLTYQTHKLSWIECVETKAAVTTRFVVVTDLKVDKKNVKAISTSGRLRFKIENEGFNTQKNGGFELQHKYSRVSNNAMKNYYEILQIAHLFHQLYVLSTKVQPMLVGKTTLKHLWGLMVGAITHRVIIPSDDCPAFQMRYG
jgi:hypothetical protein